MKVTVNGKKVETAARSLEELLAEQEFSGQRIATALNGQFVAAAARVGARLKDGDKVEIVSPRQGG
ncbi:MAG TPA: sulfur carrier protein ThiS [Hyphomicrobium sp.]|nr:sulfur carrier protein ThiS [Hyphomicrobium sp.]